MKKIILILAVTIVVAAIVTIPVIITDQFVGAKSAKKIHFTQTISSIPDPGIDHQNHQLVLILSPNEGTLFDGSFTYTSSKPVQILVLHEIASDDVKGQPTWSVDGETLYGLSIIDPPTISRSFDFTGAALALHSEDSEQFTATVSLDGWIRGQPTEVILQKTKTKEQEPALLLSRAHVPAKIPMHLGTYKGEPVYYIITDTNDKEHADLITEKQTWQVEVAPPLSEAPESAIGTVYVFTNGIFGEGIHGYQSEVLSSTPSQVDEYSALRSVTHVSWKLGQNPEVLNSIEAIMTEQKEKRIVLKPTEVVINMPQIVWPDGKMVVRQDKELTNDTPYEGGQVLDINTKQMTVTFVAHRGWGPEGSTTYYIITDATPSEPAQMMGVVDSPLSANLILYPVVVDMFQFSNGIKGSGPIGFQPGIAAAVPGDENYSPICKLFIVSWNDPKNASVLQTKADIDAFQSDDLIKVKLAQPLNSDHIVNCPFVDPFQKIMETEEEPDPEG